MPSSFGPTQPGRDWLVSPLASLPRAWGGQGEWYTMLAAAAAAIPVTALFYVDQNIVGLVLQNPQAKLVCRDAPRTPSLPPPPPQPPPPPPLLFAPLPDEA